ncbi:dihydrofolate reductase [Haloquadratum walsbyi]|uniref:dihydrofolate reductase n=1 Tax=Haloquadratum walsbyi (strain DSM 16854 / JCM 12705 / C23) TaxID=768065 RepID=G0LJ08_HALWC|nr:dihydrofolate reductase [Haloquadratum walsbyi]CCC40576.1 dihydrofolate reductase [Haloquadratum walsbyi C23]
MNNINSDDRSPTDGSERTHNQTTDHDVDIDIDIDIDIVLIAAVAANDIIGRDGEMPWHIPADLQQFKRRTMGHPVILGRRTYEAIIGALGEPFPGRTSIVLSSQSRDVPADVILVHSITSAIREASKNARERGVGTVYVAGGGGVYEQFLPLADRLRLTELHDEYEGDTKFPSWDDTVWQETTREKNETFDFVTYERTP